jgi:DNA-binding transcriptional regulator LsrR (DeoR family)
MAKSKKVIGKRNGNWAKIRKMYASEKFTQSEIARKLDISRQAVFQALAPLYESASA